MGFEGGGRARRTHGEDTGRRRYAVSASRGSSSSIIQEERDGDEDHVSLRMGLLASRPLGALAPGSRVRRRNNMSGASSLEPGHRQCKQDHQPRCPHTVKRSCRRSHRHPDQQRDRPYFKYVNDNGGVGGYKLNMVQRDSQYSPQLQVQGYNDIHNNVSMMAESREQPLPSRSRTRRRRTRCWSRPRPSRRAWRVRSIWRLSARLTASR